MADAGFENVQVCELAAPMRLPAVAHYIDFIRSSGSPILQILAPLSAGAQAAAWADMANALERFTGADGWEGPNALLLCSGALPGA